VTGLVAKLLPKLEIRQKLLAKRIEEELHDGSMRLYTRICGKNDFHTIVKITEHLTDKIFMKVGNCIHSDVRKVFQLFLRAAFIKKYDSQFFPESSACYSYFYNNILKPSYQIPGIYIMYRNLRKISQKGLLRPLVTTYLKIFPMLSEATEEDLAEDSYHIFKLVCSIAEKGEEPIPLVYSGKAMKLGFVLVKALTLTSTEYYQAVIEELAKEGVNTIFVLAACPNIEVAKGAATRFHVTAHDAWLLKDVPPYQIGSRGRSSFAYCALLMKIEL